MSFKASNVSVVRDNRGNQLIYIDMRLGFGAAVTYLGPCVQAVVLGGEAASILLDFQMRRFIVAPFSLTHSLKSQSPNLHHVTDLAGSAPPNADSTSAVGSRVAKPRIHFTSVAPSKVSKSSTRKKVMHVKRPRNSWIIYRSEKSKLLHRTNPGMSAGDISSEVSRLWRDETEEIKDYYSGLADEEARLHKEKYPDYRYTPARQ